MLIILDRDGVINFDSPDYIKTPDEWIPFPGSIDAIAELSQAGHKIVIATNQSGVNRGLFSLDVLQKIHEKMKQVVELRGGKIEKIYFCPHRPDENCDCRKPKPGMLKQIQTDYHIQNNEMIFIGDSQKDYEAARAIDCKFILVRTGNGLTAEMQLKSKNVRVVDDLMSAARCVLKR